jgi:hypothetical protein
VGSHQLADPSISVRNRHQIASSLRPVLSRDRRIGASLSLAVDLKDGVGERAEKIGNSPLGLFPHFAIKRRRLAGHSPQRRKGDSDPIESSP